MLWSTGISSGGKPPKASSLQLGQVISDGQVDHVGPVPQLTDSFMNAICHGGH